MEIEKEQKQNAEQEKTLQDQLKELVEKELKRLSESGIQVNNIDYYSKLVDIHKDIENEDYWKVKKEVYKMRYYDDDRYSDEGYSDRYSDSNYGRRGRGRNARRDSRGRYAGPGEMMDMMQEHYGDYSESRDAAGRGNYAAKEDSMKSLDEMLKSVCQFMEALSEDASPEEIQLIKKYARKIGEM